MREAGLHKCGWNLNFWEIWAHLVSLYLPCTLIAQKYQWPLKQSWAQPLSNIFFPLISHYYKLYTNFNAGVRLLNLLQTSRHTTRWIRSLRLCVYVFLHASVCYVSEAATSLKKIIPTGQLLLAVYLISDLYSEGKPPFNRQQRVLPGAFITSRGRQRVVNSAGEISHSSLQNTKQ